MCQVNIKVKYLQSIIESNKRAQLNSDKLVGEIGSILNTFLSQNGNEIPLLISLPSTVCQLQPMPQYTDR
jgi:hypothetical protein